MAYYDALQNTTSEPVAESSELTDKFVANIAEWQSILLPAAKEAGKIIVTRERHGYYSKAKFVRRFSDSDRTLTIYQRFSTVDAERAGLLPTWDDKGNLLQKGKNNWITNTPQMMNNRVISIAGRIIGADLINGVYTREEVVELIRKYHASFASYPTMNLDIRDNWIEQNL